jgi:dihydrofolate reductase
MRKVIVSINVTLDGFMAETNGALDWHFPLWDNEMAKYAYKQLSRADTILLGRITYQAMAAHYPAAGRHICIPNIDHALANMMNNYAKVVFSKKQSSLEWKNATHAQGDIVTTIASLRQQPGKHLIIFGSGSIVSQCMQLDLIDQYIVWVHPVILGKGKPLFNGLDYQLNLHLSNTKRFDSGVVVLNYDVLHALIRKG